MGGVVVLISLGRRLSRWEQHTEDFFSPLPPGSAATRLGYLQSGGEHVCEPFIQTCSRFIRVNKGMNDQIELNLG